MKKKCLLLLAALVFSSPGFAQKMVSGYVYVDENGNSQRDKKEKGIAGVSVSNGVEVATTGPDGKYQLPVADDNIIFVIKPAGYQSPLNANNLPRFYRIHKPKGSPALKYKGVAPTGPLPASLDFPLLPGNENEQFSTLLFGDPQPYTREEVNYFARGIVKEVEGVKNVAFGLSLGDLVGDDLDLHQPYTEAVRRVGIPWYNLMGNHDMNYDAVTDSLSDETYEANFGPANYAFNYGKAHFIILDNILYPDPRDGQGYWGGLRKDQLDFVENNLRFVPKDRLIVLAFHIPLHEENNDSFRDEDRQRLFDLLRDYPYTLSISAHTHQQRQHLHTREKGWRQDKPHHEYNAGTTSGDWYSGELNAEGVPYATMRDGTPKGYAFLKINGNQYAIDYKVAGKPADYRMEIYAPKVIPSDRNTSAGIYVNFFMGHRSNTVEFRVDDGPWKTMDFVEGEDPSYQHLLHRWDFTEKLFPGRRPGNASKSTHLWRSGFPPRLPAGEHFIEVRATDLFGQTFTSRRSFKVEPSAKK